MKYNRIVKGWLILGIVMLFFQIIIGGVTRITGSGLSITKWEIVTGTLPPLTEAKWQEEFNAYKKTPQYLKINQGMELGSLFDSSSFKFIYFWEYFHRLWARVMGFVFLFPIIFFIYKKWVDRTLVRKLSYVFIGAMCAALFGWIMVASGLKDRPWVNAYKLSLHLGIALLTLGFLLFASYYALLKDRLSVNNKVLYKLSMVFFVMLCIQIFFGAIVSGMKASLYYPSWPDIGGSFIPDILFDAETWSFQNLIDYDKSPLMPALIHVLHRNWGYLTYFFGLYLAFKIFRYPLKRTYYILSVLLFVLLNIQVLLGIMTLILSVGTVPVFYGVMHQAVAIFIFGIGLLQVYLFRRRNVNYNDA